MESTSTERSKSYRLQFGLGATIGVVLLLPVMVGVAAAIESLALDAGDTYFNYLDNAWTLRQTLLDSGVPIRFVTHYYTLAFLSFPGWVSLALISFALGLVHSRFLHVMAVVLSFATVLSQMYSIFVGMPSFLGMPNLYIICLAGGVVVFSSWLLGWIIRGRYNHADRRLNNMSFKVAAQIAIFAGILPLSVYGWWVLKYVQSVSENWPD